jgi:hypothetical protein
LVCAAYAIDDLLRAAGYMQKKDSDTHARSRVLVLVDEAM